MGRVAYDADFAARLQGSALATAEVLYFLPDHPDILQSFVWQTLDLAPRFPRIMRFLEFWRTDVQAPIHSVRLAHASLLTPAEVRYVQSEFRLM